MTTKLKLLAFIYVSVLSGCSARNAASNAAFAEVSKRRANPYSAVCSTLVGNDYAVFVKVTEVLASNRQSWKVLAREYNPETGDDYTRIETTGQATASRSDALRITFDENYLEVASKDLESAGSCFRASLNLDGDTLVELKCAPYGTRTRCD